MLCKGNYFTRKMMLVFLDILFFRCSIFFLKCQILFSRKYGNNSIQKGKNCLYKR